MNTEHNIPSDPAEANTDSQTLPEQAGPDPGDEQDGRPKVCVILKRLPEAVTAAQEALTAYNQPPVLFEYGGELVKLVASDGQALRVIPMKTADVQAELTYAARWTEKTPTETKAIYPPPLVVHALMQRLPQWAPPLRQMVHVPTYGKDWRLLQEPGYHSADQVFYHPDHQPLQPVSTHPSEEEVAEARRLICDELLGDFPFVAPVHLAAAVAPMIVPFVRSQIEGATPLHLFDSPVPGSGKTLLADVISIPALGKEPAATTEIANGDDLRKWVTAMAIVGEPVVLIDNINAKLQGSALAAALTKVEWSDRIVGTSRLAKGAMRCLWLATGNNIVVTTELARRIVRSRIDPGMRQPHLRNEFRHPDLRAWAKANRSRLIWAILTLVQNWLAQGRPDGQVTLGSYESYCRIVGGILQAAHIDGFLANVQFDLQHADEETMEWEAFIAAWHAHFGNKRVGAEDLDKSILAVNPEMLAVTLASTGSERGRRIKLGQELRKRRDAVNGSWRIKVSDSVDRHGCWHYHLESLVEEDGDAFPGSTQPHPLAPPGGGRGSLAIASQSRRR
jgi:putative DNA primase/helicase